MTSTWQRFSERAQHLLTPGFDRKWKAQSFLLVGGLLAFFFPFSLFFVAGGFLPAQFGWMASAIIILSGIATFLSELRTETVKTAISRFAVISGLLFFVEFLGVKTGFPFGAYVYTKELGLIVAGVPVAISVAWYSTVINAWRIAEYPAGGLGSGTPIITALFAGLLTLGLDIALEPMAGFVKRYWVWESNTVPLQNYVSWFVLSLITVYLLSRKRKERRPGIEPAMFRAAVFLFAFHFILFVVTILVNGYVLTAAIALALVLSPFLLRADRMRLLRPNVARR
jgi:uncharacterized membrane protein